MNLEKNIDTNIKLLTERFGIGESFDIIGKEFLIGNGGIRGYLLMIDGFAKDHIMLLITQRLQQTNVNIGRSFDIPRFIQENMAYMEAEAFTDVTQMEVMLLSGSIALIIDGCAEGIIIDAREYPVRSPEEPELEKVTRGPRDGFVETIIFNTALIRRRIRDPNLRFELKSVGKRTKTSVALGYIKDLVDMDYVEEIHEKIDNIQLEALTMAEKSLSELLVPKHWFNPLPQVRYTERPDVAAAHLYEGHLLIIVDTTPSIIILPTTIFHFTQHAEDYYQNPLVGTYFRFIRFTIMLLSLFLVPMWLLCCQNKELLPQLIQFIVPSETGNLPLLIQLLLLEFGLDVLRLSSIHTPSSLTTSLGIVGGLILGELAIKAGIFIPETILYTAIVGIGTFATPGIEFALAIRIFRLLLITTTGVFKFWGFVGGVIIIAAIIITTKNTSRKSYLWPLIPFNLKALVNIIIRKPIPEIHRNNR